MNVRIPIRVKLSLAITFVIFLTILILSITILTRQKDQLYSQTVKMGKVSLNHFAANANIPLLNDDIVRLNRLIKDASYVEGILYAAIVDRHNTIKAHINPNNIGMTLQTFQNKEVRKDENVTYFNYTLPSGTQVLNLSRPITFKGKELGTVHVGLSLDFINHLIYRESISILILSLFIVLSGIAVSILLGISFSRPISKLVGATQEIGKGNLQYRINMKRQDEFGDLASAVNYMADELDKKEIVNAQLFSERIRAEKEARKLEEQLNQSQKMEAIGRLAGGIAHDFNNLLTIINTHCQLTLMELKEGDPLKEKFEAIQKAGERAATLTRQLLAFSRRQVMEKKVIDINNLVLDLEKMLRRVIGEDIELRTVLNENVGRVKADPGQIEQVILNLVVNAKDAMPSGGKLTIEIANAELDEAYARSHVAVIPGRYVMLSVNDTGMGMTAEIRERIFEPFFTTKELGKGTGLGLSMVYGIVKESGGNIWVYSEPGHGATFKIYLPRVDEPTEEAGERPVKELPRGTETILVVEDEDEVRKLAVEILRGQGYTVLEAAHGGIAFLIGEQYKGSIHLMLTDVVMPGLNGFELARHLMYLNPDIKVIYMSGYTDNTTFPRGVLDSEVDFIQKPFSVEGLVAKVREVLNKC